MKYCVKCGAQQNDDAQFCQNCGQQVGPQKDESMVKLLSIISYISPLWLIGLLVNAYKNDTQVKFHVGQGIILTIVSAALGTAGGIAGGITGAIFGLISEELGLFFGWVIGAAAGAASIYLTVMGIINAATGKLNQLPFVGKYAFYK